MKTVTCPKYGPPEVLQFQEVDKPVLKEDELLIRVHATTVSSGDSRIRNGSRKSLPLWPISKMALGLRKPKKSILGMDFAGEVESVGDAVTSFKKGDQVYGFCGKGTYAEYITMRAEGSVTLMPANLTFEEAASVPFGAVSALDFLRKGKIKSGQKVLIYGASGSVGTYAVQLAKYYGAEVTGVCSTGNVDLIQSLGADRVIDYTREDFTENGETYDIIFDTVGKTSFSRCKRSLNENGHYLLAVFDYPQIVQMLWTSKVGTKKVIGGIAGEDSKDLLFLKEIIEAGKIRTVIDRRYPMAEIAEAHRYVDLGHKKGNVVINWVNKS
ncbi:NAD(P)-dependent alcohol dehydrogenase [Pseudalkalibacillus sp. SCS-8]|uniref:NAD(P)-dependent alcohol dehydrogenase n=1 Tax=Pseudalkalibacillus nanhaiensis TaxID=3115291 RepID=UPI0032DA057F